MIPKKTAEEKILIELYKRRGTLCHLAWVSKKAKVCYVHTYETINKMEGSGKVVCKHMKAKNGGVYVKLISLTEMGEKIAKHFLRLVIVRYFHTIMFRIKKCFIKSFIIYVTSIIIKHRRFNICHYPRNIFACNFKLAKFRVLPF